MSSRDSRSTVMKCMCKGAADFLIKPVRKNELTNLWQHVWRKHVVCHTSQSFLCISFFDCVLEIYRLCTCACFELCRMLFIQINRPLQNTASAQSNLKIVTEDNFARNQSTDSASVASSQKNNECSEKLSKTQVSSTYKLIS
jgi:pseudo-response regulator 5